LENDLKKYFKFLGVNETGTWPHSYVFPFRI